MCGWQIRITIILLVYVKTGKSKWMAILYANQILTSGLTKLTYRRTHKCGHKVLFALIFQSFLIQSNKSLYTIWMTDVLLWLRRMSSDIVCVRLRSIWAQQLMNNVCSGGGACLWNGKCSRLHFSWILNEHLTDSLNRYEANKALWEKCCVRSGNERLNMLSLAGSHVLTMGLFLIGLHVH